MITLKNNFIYIYILINYFILINYYIIVVIKYNINNNIYFLLFIYIYKFI